MIYCIDIDGTLCETDGTDYEHSQPLHDRIVQVNDLFAQGHTVKIFTGRGSRSGKDWRAFTESQLHTWGVKYHELIMGKPDADVFIDDKAERWDDTSRSIVFIAGNGGLCSAAEHFAAELMGKYAFDVFIPCISLTGPSSLITALANDIGYENVFAHQLEVLGKAGDTFIGLTTSHSENILKAAEVAKRKGMIVVLFDGDNLKGDTTALKQEDALRTLHNLAYSLKRETNKGT